MADKNFKKIFYFIAEEVFQLNYRLLLHDQLFDSGIENIDLLNKSGSNIFALLQGLVAENTIITLCRLTDPSKQANNENATFNYILENIPADFYKEIKKDAKNLCNACANLKKYRNKMLAHLDRKIILGETGEIDSISWKDLNFAMTQAKDLINKISNFLEIPEQDFEPFMPGESDGRKLLEVLKK